MLYNIPLIPDPGYVAFLTDNLKSIHALHFSLYDASIPDGRFKVESRTGGELSDSLRALKGPKKYCLLNSSFHAPGSYEQGEFLTKLALALEALIREGQLHGLVYVDHFMLTAFSNHRPDLAAELEAVPGVNCRIDSAQKAVAQMEYIAMSKFRPPSKLCLDRELNRDMRALQQTVDDIRKLYPRMFFELLANEGCLPRCPFKFSHDGHMAHAQTPGVNKIFSLNHDIGCAQMFHERPELLLSSPFIRPEDGVLFEGVVDALKLCGRTRGPQVMQKIVQAYLDGEFQGNLLWLNDTQEQLTPGFEIENSALPDDFGERVLACDKRCSVCGYCAELAEELLRRHRPTLD